MNEYLKDGLESLKDISEGAVPPEVYHLSAKAILEHINNLQSKIDKANEILNRPQFEYDNIPCNCEEDIKELKDILKEEKTDEETVQS